LFREGSSTEGMSTALSPPEKEAFHRESIFLALKADLESPMTAKC